MLTVLFAVLMIIVFGKLLMVAIKATWGAAKILFTIILLPLLLIGMVLGGLIYIALPVLIIIGILAKIVPKA